MKTKLYELSLASFVELVCGEKSVLLNDDEETTDAVVQEVSSDIIASYRMITDSANMKSQLLEKEEKIKMKAKILILRMCQNLIVYESFEQVRVLLEMINENADEVEDHILSVKIEELLRYALFEQRRNEELKPDDAKDKHQRSVDEIRSSFYSEIAFISTHFKMNIDLNMLNAAIYANMVHQVDCDIRAKGRRVMEN